jgi:peptidoglycan hydrolase-like protein with peptidoglycan-binding domain
MAERPVRRGVAITGVVVVVLGGTGWMVLRGGLLETPKAAAAPAIATATAPVVRADVAQREQVNGTLSYDGDLSVLAAAPGTLTRLPSVGRTVRRGQAVYEVAGKRVPLMYGDRPAWRALSLGVADGIDVEQLESNLRALGYQGITVDRHFSLATYYAVRRWQHDAHLPVTGAVPLGQVVFLAGPLRVTALDAKVGGALQPGVEVLHGTSTSPVVSIPLDPVIAPTVRTGDRVSVTLPDGRTKNGRVIRVSQVAQTSAGQQDGQPPQSLIPVTVRLSGRATRTLDQAQVQVAITSEEHKNVLAVPIVALLAQPGGKFAVVTVSGGRRTKVPVEAGLFDETAGTVEVSGVSEGALVEVPQQ